jgi:UDP-N-acetylmuramate dehydrogenase
MTAHAMNTSTDLPLIDRLPAVRGRYTPNASLAQSTWFQVGGPAEVLFKPADQDDLIHFLKNCPDAVPVMIIGVASNLIIRDGGVDGVVIKLGREFAQIEQDANNQQQIIAGAAALDGNVALLAQRHGIAGLEFLSGIPGTVGAGLRMNAGCYGSEIKDILVSATAIDRQGNVHICTADDLGMHYRHIDAPKDWMFVQATFRGTASTMDEVKARMDEIKTKRETSQPIREKTGGSTFANPERDVPGTGSAWQAVDKAGCRGMTVGGAQMSTLHCNFMINLGGATAADLENLGEDVRRRVNENSGIDLRWEIKIIGKALPHTLLFLDN